MSDAPNAVDMKAAVDRYNNAIANAEALTTGSLLTVDDRRMLSVAAVGACQETQQLLELIERLTGETIVPADVDSSAKL